MVDENKCGTNEEEIGGIENYDGGGCNFPAEHAVNCIDELEQINFKNVSPEDILMYHFPNCDVVLMFYNWYANVQGFLARKGKVMRNISGQVIQHIFFMP